MTIQLSALLGKLHIITVTTIFLHPPLPKALSKTAAVCQNYLNKDCRVLHYNLD